jgi:hypothetical protein
MMGINEWVLGENEVFVYAGHFVVILGLKKKWLE